MLIRPDDALHSDLHAAPNLLLEFAAHRVVRSLAGLHPASEETPRVPRAEGVLCEEEAPLDVTDEGQDADSMAWRAEAHHQAEQAPKRTERAEGDGERSLHLSRLAAKRARVRRRPLACP